MITGWLVLLLIFSDGHKHLQSFMLITLGQSSRLQCCFAFENVFQGGVALNEIYICQAIWEHWQEAQEFL
jgi:hypothetical protein